MSTIKLVKIKIVNKKLKTLVDLQNYACSTTNYKHLYKHIRKKSLFFFSLLIIIYTTLKMKVSERSMQINDSMRMTNNCPRDPRFEKKHDLI